MILFAARPADAKKAASAAPPAPAGAIEVAFQNVEGLILFEAKLRGEARDTTGLLVLDTGAGYLGLDLPLAARLGVTEAGASDSSAAELTLAEHPLRRLEIGSSQMDQVSPILLIDSGVIRRATGQSVLGLAGQGTFHGRALWIDYDAGRLVMVPSPPDSAWLVPRVGGSRGAASEPVSACVERSRRLLSSLLSSKARPVRIAIAGDNKILLRTRLGEAKQEKADAWLTLVFDTGATKSVLFEPALRESVPSSARWQSIRGLVAPTLVGRSDARLTLVPRIELEPADGGAPIRRTDVDCAAIETPLEHDLSVSVGEPVHGLLGYSFFDHYRVAVDPTNLILWLDTPTHTPVDRRFEHTHVGIQLELDGDQPRVLGVAEGSPAAQAGIAAGDEIVSVDDVKARGQDLLELTHRLEGSSGSKVKLVVRRGGVERVLVLTRRRLL